LRLRGLPLSAQTAATLGISQVSRVGQVINAIDTAGNLVTGSVGAYDPSQNGLNLQNGSQMVAGAIGAGQAAGTIRSASKAAGDLPTFGSRSIGAAEVPPGGVSFPGRPFKELLENVESNPLKWKIVKTEVLPSTNIRNKGGTSVQELLENEETGETIVRHTLNKADGSVFEESHYRPFWK